MPLHLEIPFAVGDAGKLRIGQDILLSGVLFTGRDVFSKYAVSKMRLPFSLAGGMIFHCGPITVRRGGQWQVMAAGPTTSARMDGYSSELARRHGVAGFIGKGGMGEATAGACRKYGCVYFSAPGGCAQLLAKSIRRVRNVYFYEEFGSPEAVWELEVEGFPCTVTMDSQGGNLHSEIFMESERRRNG